MTQERWQKITEWPLIVASLIFLGAYAWTVLGDLQPPHDDALQVVVWVVWAIFVVDYMVNLVLAEKKWRWFYRHILDLLIVALPVLRPLRLLRLVGFISVFNRLANGISRGSVAIYTISYGTVIVLMASLAILDAEQNDPHATIKNFGEALWWATETITTVGYGDFVPVTVTGRLVAVVLMISSIVIIGTVAGMASSWLVERFQKGEEREQKVTRKHISELMRELETIKAMLAESGRDTTQRAVTPDPEPDPSR